MLYGLDIFCYNIIEKGWKVSCSFWMQVYYSEMGKKIALWMTFDEIKKRFPGERVSVKNAENAAAAIEETLRSELGIEVLAGMEILDSVI